MMIRKQKAENLFVARHFAKPPVVRSYYYLENVNLPIP